MNYLQLDGKTFLVTGVANRKSVAWHTAQLLEEAGAKVIYSVRSDQRKDSLKKLLGDRPVYICDVEHQSEIDRLQQEVSKDFGTLHGLVHSIAFADYSAGWKPYNETPRAAFLQSVNISCFSLMALSEAFKEQWNDDASIVTVSISTTRMAAENYGFMGPVKAALDSSVCFLAKSF